MPTRRAFARADALAVLALFLIGGLVAAPALLRARLAANEAHKTASYHQVALGVAAHHENFGAFPSVGGTEIRANAQLMPILHTPAGPIMPSLKAQDGNKYGAIAYSFKTGNYGYSYNFDTEDEAKRTAIKYCKEADCQVITIVGNGCTSLAVGDGNGYGYGFARDRAGAENRAMEECKKRTANCRLICWTCTDR